MFLVTAEERELNSEPRKYDPMRDARPFADEQEFEIKGGKAHDGAGSVATPLEIAEGLKDVFDPEIPVNIYDLGLIYDIHVSETADVSILMTLTSPTCPVAGDLPGWVAQAALAVKGVGNVGVKLTFEPAWNPDMMTELARTELGIY